MSNEYEKKIENLFLSKIISVSSSDLNNIINESLKRINEAGSYSPTMQQIMRMLPKFEFKESRMGALNSETKKQFRSFFDEKLKSAMTLKEKLSVIQNFCGQVGKKDTKESTDVILSRLMMLKIIENIIIQSSPGSAGYQFEALIASMFGTGQQLGGRAERRAEDIIIGNNRYQVKLIKNGGSVTIAYSNMEKYFFDDKEKMNKDKTLGFIIAEKSDKQLIFYQTFLKMDDYILLRDKYGKKINDKRAQKQPLQQKDDIKLATPEADKTALNEQVDAQPLGEPQGNFYLPRSYFVNNFAGAISVSDRVFEYYNNLLDNNVKEVLMNVADLIDNVNKFYINNDANAASEGVKNANSIIEKIKQ